MNCSKVIYQTVLNITALLFMVLFVYAASTKLISFDRFNTQLIKSPFVSRYASIIAWVVPFFELLIVGLFLFPKSRLLAFYSSLSLMTVFTVYIFMVINFSSSLPCACGGVISSLDWRAHFVFNIIFIVLAIVGIILIHQRKNHSIKNKTT